MKVLVTGFSPFGGDSTNASSEAVKLLPDTIEGARIIKAELPTVFGKGAEALENLIQQHRPDVVICTGQAERRAGISVERVAINLRDSRIADNEGNSPQDEAIIEGGQNAYFSNLPTRKIVGALLDEGIPAALSYTTGTYVCNDVMYHLLFWIEKRYPRMRGGFIHVPCDTAQAAKISPPPPSMPVTVTARALVTAIRAVCRRGDKFP
jgi:pyroglutamyl-peptidase